LTYPNNNPPNGMSGDFEFIIQNRTDDKLELIGRKKRVRLELVKATDQDWTNLAKQSEIQSNIALKVEGRTKEKWVIALNGAPVQGALAADPLQHTFTITIGATNYTATYAITPDGLVFGKPVALKIGSETVTLNGLSYQSGATDVDRKFISADGSLVFGIETETLYLYEDFIGTYTLRYATSNTATTRTRSATVTVVEEQRGSTYTLNGILADDSPGKLIMRYNANGTVSLLGQIMHVYPDTKYDFWWLPYSKPDNGNFTSRTTTYGQVSVEIEMSADEKLSYNMVDNGVWTSYGGTAGFILRNYNGSTSAGNVNGKDGQYAYFFLRFEMN
jgi:hypothetical protein